MPKRVDLKGRRFGRLTAIVDVGRNKDGSRVWHCECSCGGFVKVAEDNLASGTTKSCGCLYRDTRIGLARRNGWLGYTP